jgi:hypothetical protein
MYASMPLAGLGLESVWTFLIVGRGAGPTEFPGQDSLEQGLIRKGVLKVESRE